MTGRCFLRTLPVVTAAFAVCACIAPSVASAREYFPTLPVGSALPRPDSECASRVTADPWEPKPENNVPNHSVPTAPVPWNNDPGWTYWSAFIALRNQVTGNYTGTTDEIFRWAACKWGIDEDVIRAVAYMESTWRQDFSGDYENGRYHSFGLMQIRHDDANGNLVKGGYPATLQDSALNVDYFGAEMRACYEGAFYSPGSTWLYGGTQVKGDLWGCIGYWNQGDWYTPAAVDYIHQIQNLVNTKPWLAWNPTPQPSSTGGVRVALGDVNGDGKADIVTAAGAGGAPLVTIYNGADGSVLRSFYPYASSFTGGVYVAAADVNGDGKADVITGAGPGGGPHVEVFSGADNSVLASFFAYSPSFTGGVRVASGDVNGDGKADIVTAAGPGGGPHVQVFDGANPSHVLQSFFAYSPSFTGGVFVGAGDVNGDGKADVVTGAGPGGGPHVEAFSGANGAVLDSFFAYAPTFTGGVRVAAADVNGDGKADILTAAGPGPAQRVEAFSGANGSLLTSFLAYGSFGGGAFVGGGDVDHDGHADIGTGADAGGGPHVEVFSGASGAVLRSFFAF